MSEYAKDPITDTPSHEAWAEATTKMKQLEPTFNQAHLLHSALTIGVQPYGGKADSPWTPEQHKTLLDKYHALLISL